MVKIHSRFNHHSINFGNKLFIYGISRYIAEYYGLRFERDNYFSIYRGKEVYDFPYGNLEGKEISEPEFVIHDWVNYTFERLISECKDKRVIWAGYYLRYDILKPIKNYIKNLYKDLTLPADNKNDVVILLRNSNQDSTFSLPDDYYVNILKNLKFDNLYVSYDHLEKHTQLLDKLSCYSPILLDLNSMDLLRTITSKKTLLCCQGTYSFWAAFLSNAEKIYWPITKIGPNRLDDPYVKLNIDDDNRIEFVNIW